MFDTPASPRDPEDTNNGRVTDRMLAIWYRDQARHLDGQAQLAAVTGRRLALFKYFTQCAESARERAEAYS